MKLKLTKKEVEYYQKQTDVGSTRRKLCVEWLAMLEMNEQLLAEVQRLRERVAGLSQRHHSGD